MIAVAGGILLALIVLSMVRTMIVPVLIVLAVGYGMLELQNHGICLTDRCAAERTPIVHH